MYPLTLANPGDEVTILRVGGTQEIRKHLEDIGFVCGSVISVVTSSTDHPVIRVKDTRVALGKELAAKIMVQ